MDNTTGNTETTGTTAIGAGADSRTDEQKAADAKSAELASLQAKPITSNEGKQFEEKKPGDAGYPNPTTGEMRKQAADERRDPNEGLTVPYGKILAFLPHPRTEGTPVGRGVRYKHHYEVELVSDGSRFFAVDSPEGQDFINRMASEGTANEDAIAAAKAG